MTTRKVTMNGKPASRVVVWIDRAQAFIVGQASDGHDRIELVDRRLGESEAAFEARIVDEVGDEEHVVVSGPTHARTDFERAFVAVTHRPERLTDVEPRSSRRRNAG